MIGDQEAAVIIMVSIWNDWNQSNIFFGNIPSEFNPFIYFNSVGPF